MQKDHYHFVSLTFFHSCIDEVTGFFFFLPGGVRAHNGLFIHFTFETSSTFHLVAKNQSLAFVDKH